MRGIHYLPRDFQATLTHYEQDNPGGDFAVVKSGCLDPLRRTKHNVGFSAYGLYDNDGLEELAKEYWLPTRLSYLDFGSYFSFDTSLLSRPDDLERTSKIAAGLMFMRCFPAPEIDIGEAISPGYDLPAVEYRGVADDGYVFTDAESEIMVSCKMRASNYGSDFMTDISLVSLSGARLDPQLQQSASIAMHAYRPEHEGREVNLGAVLGAFAIERVKFLS
jgi:hypothetical protein